MVNVPDTSARTQTFVESQRRLNISVVVVLESPIHAGKKWAYPEWSVYSVVTTNRIQGFEQQVTVHDDGATQRYFWSGLSLDLHKDGSEGYWYNLLSETPYLFVVCNGSIGDMEIEPRYITANQDEASGHLESIHRRTCSSLVLVFFTGECVTIGLRRSLRPHVP